MDDFVQDGLVLAHLLLVCLKLKLVPVIYKVNSDPVFIMHESMSLAESIDMSINLIGKNKQTK